MIQIDFVVIQTHTQQEGLKTHYNIMGVVSQYVPYEDVWQNVKNGLKNSSWFNSGYSVVVSIDKVLELI